MRTFLLLIGTKENVLPANMLLFCLTVSEPKIAEYSGKHTISVRLPFLSTYCSCATSPLRTRKTLGGLPSSGPWRSSPDTVSTNTTVLCDVKSRGSAWIETASFCRLVFIRTFALLAGSSCTIELGTPRCTPLRPHAHTLPPAKKQTANHRAIQPRQDHQTQPVIDQRGSLAGVLYPRMLLTEILQTNPKPASMFAFPGPLARHTRGADRYQHPG